MSMTTMNPVQFASQVNEQFLDYQLTAFPLTDPDLAGQARMMLRGMLGRSPLIQGPYVSLSKSFQQGRDLRELAREGIVHPALPGLAPYPALFAHQYKTLKEVSAGRHCLIATGTGSGKTEAFLYPILNHCLQAQCKRVGPLVHIWVMQLNERGKLMLCPSCGQRSNTMGDRVTEPIKPLRAVTVADVHILAQNMINTLRGPQQKLIVFTDNRQDAAFQAGWMQDHARRYRLRHLIYDYLSGREHPCSITDVREHLMTRFRQDRALARVLAPEVFAGRADEAFGHELDKQLSYYLHILLVREWSTGFKQRDSLETWGKARVIYAGVSAEQPWIQEWAAKLRHLAEELATGIASLLDAYRRNRLFYDSGAPIFTRYWREGDDEVQRGFLPFFDFPPKGMKEQRETSDRDIYVIQFRSKRGQTLTQNYLSKWNLPAEQYAAFQDALWPFLSDIIKVLEPVTLVGARQRALPGATGVYQVSAAKCGLITQHERYRCNERSRPHALYRRATNQIARGHRSTLRTFALGCARARAPAHRATERAARTR
jgi:DEAD/DEAH box helicase